MVVTFHNESLRQLKRLLGRRISFCFKDKENDDIILSDNDENKVFFDNERSIFSEEVAAKLKNELQGNKPVAYTDNDKNICHICAPVLVHGTQCGYLYNDIDWSKFVADGRNINENDLKDRLGEISETISFYFENKDNKDNKNNILRLEKIKKTNETFVAITHYLEEQVHEKTKIFDLDRIIYSILTGITCKDFLEYSRAIFLYYDDKESLLIGKMGIGYKNSDYPQQCLDLKEMEELNLEEYIKKYDILKSKNELYGTNINPLVGEINIKVNEKTELYNLLRNETEICQIINANNKIYKEFGSFGDLQATEYIVGALRIRNELKGVLLIDNEFKRKFHEVGEDKEILAGEDLQPLENFITQAAFTLDNAQLYKQNLIVKSLMEAFRNVQKIDLFMNKVTDTINTLFDAELTSVFIYDNLKEELILYGLNSFYRDKFKEKDKNLAKITYKSGDGWTGLIFSTEKALRKKKNSNTVKINGTKFHPKMTLCDEVEITDPEKRSFLGVPIKIGGVVNAVLWIISSPTGGNYNVEDEIQLNAAAEFIGLKIFELVNTEEQIELKEAVFSEIILNKLKNLKKITYNGVFGKDGFFITKTGNYTKTIDTIIQETLEKILNFEDLKDISDLTKLLKDFEPLLQNLPQYRDHFIHQFQVFQLGCVIIDKYFNEFKKAYSSRYKKIVGEKVDSSNIKRNLEFTWFLASAFHDIGYSLQKFDFWMQFYFKKLFKIECTIADLNLDVIKKEKGFNRCITEIISDFFKSTEIEGNKYDFVEYILNSLTDDRDHGVISAIAIMFYLMDKLNSDDILIKYQLKEALLAILLHNFNIWKETRLVYNFINNFNSGKLKNTYKGESPNFDYKIFFIDNPIAFLLILLDNIQEWGRPKEGKIRSFEDEFYLVDINLKQNECSFYLSMKNHSDRRVSDKRYYINTLEEILKSDNIGFKICYRPVIGKGYGPDSNLTTFNFMKP